MNRKRILAISFFPAFVPANSGGELRLYNLYLRLSKYYDVTLVSSTHFDVPPEEVRHCNGFREVRIPKDRDWQEAYGALRRAGVDGELSGLAFSIAVENPGNSLRRRAIELAGEVDAVIHESPFSEPIFSSGCPVPEIYCSHNIESALLPAVAYGPGFNEAFIRVTHLEECLVARAALVTATSNHDETQFRLLWALEGDRAGIVANGYDTLIARQIWEARQRDAEGPQKIVFGGSRHKPNVDAAEYIISIARKIPHLQFELFGAVCEEFSSRNIPQNCRLYGLITDGHRANILASATAVLNPVETGSGTNLKSLEALACGIPLICTPFGARGLDVQDMESAIVRSKRGLLDFLSNPAELRCLPQIGEQGRKLFLAKYTWDTIAQNFCSLLEKVIARRRIAIQASQSANLILVLNDYQVGGEFGGGAERIRQIYRHYAGPVVLLTLGSACGVRLLADNVLEITLEKSRSQRNHEAAWRKISPDVSAGDIISSLHIRHNTYYQQMLFRYVDRAKCVVLEHCYLEPLASLLRSVRPSLPIIYSAHNIEARLKSRLLGNTLGSGELISVVQTVEAQLTREADVVVACSAEERRYFQNLGAKQTILARNGAVRPSHEAAANWRGYEQGIIVGFIGSAHPPNVDAVRFLIEEVAPKCPTLIFEVIGAVCDSFSTTQTNVRLLSRLDDEDRDHAMAYWAIAVNPVVEGGGTNLKTADFIVRGLPVVSTRFGTRGLTENELENVLVKERHEFAAGILELATKLDLHSSSEHISLEWKVVAEDFLKFLEKLPPSEQFPPKKLLIVSYRYTEPTLGGAEEYILNVSRYLRPYFKTIDFAAPDVVETRDHHHFATLVEDGGCGPARVIGAAFDRVHIFSVVHPPEDEVVEICNRLEQIWQDEEEALSAHYVRQLATRDGYLVALEGVKRTSDRAVELDNIFTIAVPIAVRRLRFVGAASGSVLLAVSCDNLPPTSQRVEGSFSFEVQLPRQGQATNGFHLVRGTLDGSNKGCITIQVVGVAGEEGDFIFRPATKLVPNSSGALSSLSFRQRMSSFAEIAARRSKEMDEAFDTVRGPHSTDLENWVGENYKNYDVVLVQGVPFRTVPSTLNVIRSRSREFPVVLLPHFHADDRFYWWNLYLNAFRSATCTIVPSQRVADFFEDEGIRCSVVAHGALAADELTQPSSRTRLQLLLPHLQGPFVLVLGRKTPSKGYERVARAISKLRANGVQISLVMIGPDEDKRPVNGDGIFYLGRQPRSVVLSALQEALCLVTLSISESFGIVILEAWRASKAVIGNASCMAHCDLIRTGVDGILVKDDVELEGILADWSAHPEKADDLGRAGSVRLTSGFTWDHLAHDIAKILAPQKTVVGPT